MPPEKFDIRRVDHSHEVVMRNLLELYCHDMAEWFLFDANEVGLYSYASEKVWANDIDVFLAYAGAVPVGFALVASAAAFVRDPDAKDMEEFFVVRRHRRSGLGQALATHVWDLYPGRWLIRVYQGNLPAVPFWRGIITRYTHGNFTEEVRRVSDRPWSYFSFERSH
jgi:predicted acetyltransferase